MSKTIESTRSMKDRLDRLSDDIAENLYGKEYRDLGTFEQQIVWNLAEARFKEERIASIVGDL